MKRFLSILLLIVAGFVIGSAFTSSTRSIEYLPKVFKKNVSVGAYNTNAVPDTNVFLQIGDVDSSTKCSVLFYWTDTAKVTKHKKRGTLILNTADTCLYLYTGARWRKVGS